MRLRKDRLNDRRKVALMNLSKAGLNHLSVPTLSDAQLERINSEIATLMKRIK